MARGGRRPGSGRKPKYPGLRVVKAGDLKPGLVVPPFVPPTTNVPPPPIEEFDAPDSLTFEERAVWMAQAPYAFRQRTLTRASAVAFERYCKIAILERNEAKSSAVGGPNHRGLLKQINQYELQFMLVPAGRAMQDPAPEESAPVSKLSRFRA